MPNFISDFFETRGWLGIVQRNPTTGSLSAGGETITGVPSTALAETLTATYVR